MIPESINILSTDYQIEYFDNLSDVDVDGKKQLLGQILYDDEVIRIYRGERSENNIWKTIFHEVIHGIVYSMNIREVSEHEEEEHIVDTIAQGLFDTLLRNKILEI